MNDNVIAIVVTYNRKALLMECLDAILNQTYSITKLLLIDNSSTDGTDEALKENGYLDKEVIEYVKLESNTGGAGGFYEGMLRAQKYQYDWIWMMDDDTIPKEDCLEKLLEAKSQINGPISFLASSVFGANGEFMNVPKINTRKAENGYSYWYQYLNFGIVNISMATFVSILVNKKAIDKCGLPCKDFFIWGDDSEYTTRLSKYYGDAYFVGSSVAIHKRALTSSISIDNEQAPGRIDMFHYKFRNAAIINRYYEPSYHFYFTFALSIAASIKYLIKENGFRKMRAIVKGNVESLIQYRRFEQYIDSQIRKV